MVTIHRSGRTTAEPTCEDKKPQNELRSSDPATDSCDSQGETSNSEVPDIHIETAGTNGVGTGVTRLLKANQNTNSSPQFQQPQPEKDVSSSVTLPEPELFFQAVGLVRGQYLPSAGTPGQGILLLNDNLMTPTNLLASAAYTVDKHSELLESPQVWIVYPRPMQESPRLHFAIRGVRNPLPGEDAEVIEQSVDGFTIRGIVCYHKVGSDEFAVRVYRNFRPWHELDGTKYKPYSFTIAGMLPTSSSAYGQFWNLKVKRVSDQLVLEEATFVAQVLPPKQPKKKRSKHRQKP